MTRWRRNYYLIPVVALLIPFFANEYLLWVVNAMLVYTLVTVGFNLIIGNLGQLAFASTAFFGIGSYTTAILMVYFGVPYVLAILASAVIGGIAGFLTSVTALRGIRLYYLAIITLAFGELMRWVYLHGDKVTDGSDGLLMPSASFFWIPLDSESPKFYVFLLLTVIVVKATSNLMRSKIGRAIVAIRENESATASLGIYTARYIILAFVWSGSVIGIAGAMFAVLTERVLPEAFGLTEVIIHFGMVLVGGTGSIVGSVLGAITLTALPEYFRQFPGMDELFFGIIIVLVLLFLPKGLVSLLHRISPVFHERYYRD
ncbi:MAG: branched-chain amino acid ABC transporter permease [Gammaproteobacteria bacterium]|nr:branched-chain amino acid ABC transporter permease [Gammaproteobacteria bacterium]NCF80195.1 branched-chain amino acid ABC transporter permease [Pseudomonadota bacterium]